MKKKKIAIVGAGKIFQKNYSFLKNIYEIVGIFDSNKTDELFDNTRIKSIKEIIQYKYDYIFVTSLPYALEIKHNLKEMGVDDGIIRPFIGNTEEFDYRNLTFINDRIHYDDGVIRFDIGQDEGIGGVKEIYVDDTYNLHMKGECIVIDIGMNIGCSVLYFAAMKNVKKVYGFEPFKKTYGIARRNIDLNDEEIKRKIETYNIGLGKENKTIQVSYDSSWLTTFSTIDSADDNGKDVVYIREASEIIESIINDNHTKVVLKIDCEGAEYDILRCLQNKMLLSNINVIMMEYHKGKIDDLGEALGKNGFTYFVFKHNRNIGMIYAIRSMN